jgi:hypothetical protein
MKKEIIMDSTTRTHMDNILSDDRQLQNDAFMFLIAATDQPVPWAYEAWDEIVANLSHKNNRVRAISAQLLCNLAKSDPQNRILDDFPALLNVTRDPRFVTARHTLQNIWKVGLAGPQQQALLLSGLEERYHECVSEKQCTLIRFDIIQDFKNLYDAAGDEAIKQKAEELIAQEEDAKYRKKYAAVWR